MTTGHLSSVVSVSMHGSSDSFSDLASPSPLTLSEFLVEHTPPSPSPSERLNFRRLRAVVDSSGRRTFVEHEVSADGGEQMRKDDDTVFAVVYGADSEIHCSGHGGETHVVQRKSLKLLIDFLEAEYAKFNKELRLQIGSGLIDYAHLWAIFSPSTIVYSRTGDSLELPTTSLVTWAGYKIPEEERGQHEPPFYLVRSKTVYFDGNKVALGSLETKIEHFAGMVKIASLVCYPFEYHENKARLGAQLVERGKKYLSLQGRRAHHKLFTGVAYRKFLGGKLDLQQDRIMIDGETLRSLCLLHGARDVAKGVHAQDDSNVTGFLINGRSPRYLLDLLLSEAADDSEQNTGSKSGRDGEHSVQGAGSTHGDGEGNAGICDECQRKTRERLKEAKKTLSMIFHPTITGYSLAHWSWFEFPVDGIQEVKWDGQAWDYLMLEEHAKELMRTSVIPHVAMSAPGLRGSGPGGRGALNILLHGPSDTGKTLTVEALCDHLQVPLMRISVGSFTMKTEIISAALIDQKMLEVCHRWGAVLLINDLPFLWSQMSLIAQHAQWPSVILQHLTSPRRQGVIFFACKGGHVNWVDGALPQIRTQEGMPRLRFNLSFRYTFPTRYGRTNLIRKCLARALERGQVQMAPLNDVGLHRLANSDLTYRETRNVVQLALDWVCEKEEVMPLAVLQQLLDMPREHRRGPPRVDSVQSITPSTYSITPDLG
ncbi:hypothetical protein CCMA1212_003060 [Trichoderma ghanense]|uniref:ATPase AAA-type core domain-containing protein n=1 Tax=Trichoderma ghanense TaxID=65468 RepID=A0ABY2HAU7_9HYPO